MNCSEFRAAVSRRLSDHASALESSTAPGETHDLHCESCRVWLDEQMRLDGLIAEWAQNSPEKAVPSPLLEDQILVAWNSTREGQTVRGTTQPIGSRNSSRRGLTILLGSLAVSILLLLPQLTLVNPRTNDFRIAERIDSTEAAPVTSLVASVRNVVENVSVATPTTVVRLSSENLLPDWQVGTLQFSPSSEAVPGAWNDVRQDLEPLRSEVQEAFGFIWSALPDEES